MTSVAEPGQSVKRGNKGRRAKARQTVVDDVIGDGGAQGAAIVGARASVQRPRDDAITPLKSLSIVENSTSPNNDDHHAPQDWPPSAPPYLYKPQRSPLLTPAHLKALQTRPPADHASSPVPTLRLPRSHAQRAHIAIRPISHPSHPACGQHGLFAAERLTPDALVTVYLGVVLGANAGVEGEGEGNGGDVRSDYEISLDRDAGLAVDAAGAGNEGRFVNDYRGVPLSVASASVSVSVSGLRARRDVGRGDGGGGISNGQRRSRADGLVAGPNAEFRDVWLEYLPDVEDEDEGEDENPGEVLRGVGLDRRAGPEEEVPGMGRRDHRRSRRRGKKVGEKGIAIFVLGAGKTGLRKGGIKAGEEILVSYGKGFWEERRKEGEKLGEG